MSNYQPPQLSFKPSFTEVWESSRFNIGTFSERFLGITLSPKQDEWARSSPWAVESLLISGNRFGKSFVESVEALHSALFQTRPAKYAHMTHIYNVACLSLTMDMAMIGFATAMTMALDSPLYRQFVIEDGIKGFPFPVMPIGDGKKGKKGFRSEIWARSTANKATYLRGKSVDRFLYDECAYQPDGQEVVDSVLLMRLADRAGKIKFLTSPNGKNWLYQKFSEAIKRPEEQRPPHYYYALTATSYDNAHIDHERLDINAERMGLKYKQENIDGIFVDVNGVFSSEAIERCYKDIDYQMPVPPEKDALYLKAFDFANLHDTTVGLVARIDRTPAELVFAGQWGGEGTGVSYVGEGGIYEQVSKIHHMYPGPIWGDGTGPGGKLIMESLRLTYNLPMKESDVAGARGRAKEDLLLAGRQGLEGRKVIWPVNEKTKKLINELRYYTLPDIGHSTDWVMSYCILCEGLRKEAYIHELPQESVAVWATNNGVVGECDCQLTRDLTYCLRHHLPVVDSACCGGESEPVIIPNGQAQILQDMQGLHRAF